MKNENYPGGPRKRKADQLLGILAALLVNEHAIDPDQYVQDTFWLLEEEQEVDVNLYREHVQEVVAYYAQLRAQPGNGVALQLERLVLSAN